MYIYGVPSAHEPPVLTSCVRGHPMSSDYCILALYRSTAQPMNQVTSSVNAAITTIADAGHWWMCSHPEQAASILIEHWERFEK